LALTAIASGIGLVAAVVLTRFMASMLFNVAPRDPLTFALVAVVLRVLSWRAPTVVEGPVYRLVARFDKRMSDIGPIADHPKIVFVLLLSAATLALMALQAWLIVVAKRVAIDYMRGLDTYIDRRREPGASKPGGRRSEWTERVADKTRHSIASLSTAHFLFVSPWPTSMNAKVDAGV
jgi:hypothetical protein